jgi:hypothetical protein
LKTGTAYLPISKYRSRSSLMRVPVIQTGIVRVRTAQIEGQPPSAPLAMLTGVNWSDWLPTYVGDLAPEGSQRPRHGQGPHLLKSARSFQICGGGPRFELNAIGPQLRAVGGGPRDVNKVVHNPRRADGQAVRGYLCLPTGSVRRRSILWRSRAVARSRPHRRRRRCRRCDVRSHRRPCLPHCSGRRRDRISCRRYLLQRSHDARWATIVCLPTRDPDFDSRLANRRLAGC